jgi:glyoxylase-like metal-dependent hydrolase (beta-lactamase superfamily II)
MYVDTFSLEVETRAPTGQTNAYLVSAEVSEQAENGSAVGNETRETLLVDPAARSETLDAVVAENGVDHIAVTHTHPDHVGAVATYAAETDATVWARYGREARFRAATGVDPDRTFSGGDRVGPARVLDTPGHAPDHVAFETDCGTVSGDLAVASGSVAVASPEGDLRAYLTSLRRVLVRDPAALYPSHGPEIDTPRETCERLIHHRRDRERAVLDAVQAGARELDAVVTAAYEKDLTGVRDLARATVVAHIEKLASEGRVSWDADAGRVDTR